jgi:hypothetical protein
VVTGARSNNVGATSTSDTVRDSTCPDKYDRPMDFATVVLPGAQSIVSTILTETWSAARNKVARLWAKHQGAEAGAAEGTEAEQEVERFDRASTELDLACKQSLEIAGSGSPEERAARMSLFWAGYLAAQAQVRPALADALAELPSLLGGREVPQYRSTVTHNEFSGTASGPVLQIGHIEGGSTIGRL